MNNFTIITDDDFLNMPTEYMINGQSSSLLFLLKIMGAPILGTVMPYPDYSYTWTRAKDKNGDVRITWNKS